MHTIKTTAGFDWIELLTLRSAALALQIPSALTRKYKSI